MAFSHRAVGGADRKSFAVDLEFFDDVIPQVEITTINIFGFSILSQAGVKTE